ncbi:hypothetical protein N7519_000253 [Penicillium mononematosum]|uniref:uncharacterized protein n=1 Tax=Penicillium mononematosum TaxID=268346 RepID=UPI00254717E2|nr:uncharacterized protein N7519_000253 [Penicillium mononematosum]KAJ6190232.1 hypothetical protein N7519_000253 [Penicillium mononematosum]
MPFWDAVPQLCAAVVVLATGHVLGEFYLDWWYRSKSNDAPSTDSLPSSQNFGNQDQTDTKRAQGLDV